MGSEISKTNHLKSNQMEAICNSVSLWTKVVTHIVTKVKFARKLEFLLDLGVVCSCGEDCRGL